MSARPVLLAAILALAAATPARAALSIAVPTPVPPLALTPGGTASAFGVVSVTPDPLNPAWSLSVADTSGGAGHLLRGTGAVCAGVETQTVNQLSVRAAGSVPTTSSADTKTVGTTPATVATGTVLDPAVQVTFSLAVLPTEVLSSACTMRTTVTYTVQ
ncbi:MAG TPA: hypothetical protein VF066_11825 [Thermoleophilaceae bacterium]